MDNREDYKTHANSMLCNMYCRVHTTVAVHTSFQSSLTLASGGRLCLHPLLEGFDPRVPRHPAVILVSHVVLSGHGVLSQL